MKIDAEEMYEMTPEKEKNLWGEAIFVFDSCALLDLYYIPVDTRKDIYKEIFQMLPNRLWIPYHVQYEYLKNRKKVIAKPISENYSPLKKSISETVNLIKKDLANRITSIEDETKTHNKHPSLDQQHISDFKDKFDDFIAHVGTFEEKSTKVIEEKIEEIKNIENDDDILNVIESKFSVGRDYSFDEIIDITKEGKHRYEFKIPPGYGDFSSKKMKKGTQIFGDLIIWKQILEFSKNTKKPIIFITNDITKDDDWCYVDNKNSDRVDRPREELIKEIRDHSGIDFWIYSLPQLIYKAEEYLKSDIEREIINDVSKQMFAHSTEVSSVKEILEVIHAFTDLYPNRTYEFEDFLVLELTKYLEILYPEIEILRLTDSKSKNADLILKRNNNLVLVEVTLALAKSLLAVKTERLLKSLIASGIQNGILYAPRYTNPSRMKFGSVSKVVDGISYNVSQVFSKS